MYAPSRTNSPCAKLKIPIMLAMMPSPSTTRTTIAPKLMISNNATKRLSMRHHRERVSRLHGFPVAGLFEGMRGAIDRRLVEMPADQHQAHGQSVHHAARQRHRRMVRDIERRGVGDHLEGALHHL